MASKSYWGNGPDNTAATGLKVVEMNRGKLAGRTTRMADVKTMVCKEKEWTAKTSATLQKQESNWNRTKKEEVGRRKKENLRSQRRRFRFETTGNGQGGHASLVPLRFLPTLARPQAQSSLVLSPGTWLAGVVLHNPPWHPQSTLERDTTWPRGATSLGDSSCPCWLPRLDPVDASGRRFMNRGVRVTRSRNRGNPKGISDALRKHLLKRGEYLGIPKGVISKTHIVLAFVVCSDFFQGGSGKHPGTLR
ncbi:hypothetical protein DER46DRAFT_571641 [Fusarium sp. MPI-SDFR-AT-0072]|nr:hypothetical protein DER46DRAFT_571641 [Fusarium sp. MPI-SDFR-AT-0072]